MNESDKMLEIKFTKNALPRNIGASELMDIVGSVNRALMAIVRTQAPDVVIEKSVVSLVHIDEGSAKYGFVALLPAAMSAFGIWTSSIASSDYIALPDESVESAQKISSLTAKYHCEAEFRTDPGSSEPVAMITPSTEIAAVKSHYLTGETELYGRVERVGGIKPTVWIRLADKETVICSVAEEVAKELARRLYSWVSLFGRAQWDTKDYSLKSFEIFRITEYRETPLPRAMDELSSLLSKHFKGITDVVTYISELRGKAP